MTFVPSVAVIPAAELTSVIPVAADVPAVGDKSIQALFDGISYAGLQGELFSGAELLGPAGSTVVRGFLNRAKQEAARASEAREGIAAAAGKASGMHGGPAREPFREESPAANAYGSSNLNGNERDESARMQVERTIELLAEGAEFRIEATYVAAVTKKTTDGVNQLIKGQ